MYKNRICLFDAEHIEELPWPQTEQAMLAKQFLVPLIKQGVHRYIENVHTDLYILLIDDLVLPVTINDSEYGNSFVCSPYDYYIGCGLESVVKMDHWLKRPLKALLNGLSGIFKAGKINKVVMINNWFFSTNLYPKLSPEQIECITQFLKNLFPGHALMFRSIQTFTGNELYAACRQSSFNLIASRMIFYLNAADEEVFRARIFKSDFKLLQETEYEIEELQHLLPDQSTKIAELYSDIYCSKHSEHNPKLTSRFFQLAFDSKLLHIKTLHKEGEMAAVVGYWQCDGVMMAPLLGYEANKSEDKLYRLSCTVLTQEARDKKWLFHLSSGASFYKKIRKAKGSMEYFAVYHRHLPFYRRLPWWVLQATMNSIGVPIMKRYDK